MRAAEDLLVQKALDLKNTGDMSGAVDLLEKLVKQHPNSGLGQSLLGAFCYYGLHEPQKALHHLRIGVQLCPKSERASLGLFHCLWAMDRLDEALEEMKRYQVLTNWSCEDYREILAEINEKWTDDEPIKPKRRSAKRTLTKSLP